MNVGKIKTVVQMVNVMHTVNTHIHNLFASVHLVSLDRDVNKVCINEVCILYLFSNNRL
jgi:hypothetical protein